MELGDKELRYAQLLMLEILKEVHRICKENNIKYFLSDGTLIGAVRHNGFIPWDDDLDIGMLREDYDKFIEIAPTELGDKFILQNTKTDFGYAWQFSKVMLKNTKWIENGAKNTERKYCGIYIDIFPYDKISKNYLIRNCLFGLYKFFDALIVYGCNYFDMKNKKTIKNFFKKLFLSVIPVKWVINWRDNINILKKNSTANKCLVTKYGGDLNNNINTYNAYKNLKLHDFENYKFYIPIEYDSILTKLYGDYMTIPSASEIHKHNIIEYDFGNIDLDLVH